jgi:hypothetical protein
MLGTMGIWSSDPASLVLSCVRLRLRLSAFEAAEIPEQDHRHAHQRQKGKGKEGLRNSRRPLVHV